MSGGEADELSRVVIAEAGYGENFGHSLGHGVGLAIHEFPRVGPNSKNTLEEGTVFTVEPGIYLSGGAASGSRMWYSWRTMAPESLARPANNRSQATSVFRHNTNGFHIWRA